MITLKLVCPLCTDEMRTAGLSGDIGVAHEDGMAELALVSLAYQYNWGPVPGHKMVCGKHRIRKSAPPATYVTGTCTASDPSIAPLYRCKAWEVD